MAITVQEQVNALIVKINAELSQRNRKALQEYVDWMHARGSNSRTVLKRIYSLKKFLDSVNSADVIKLSKKDIEHAVAKVNSMDLSEETKRDVRATIKQFYKHMVGDDSYYPPQAAWIKTSINRSKKTLPEILNEEEVKRMIEASQTARDKCIIALLFDSGIRIGELLNLRIKDVEMDQEPAHITVNGKTGMRRIPLSFSQPYIANYLGTMKDRDLNDPFLKAIGSWSNLNRTVDRAAVTKVLKIAGRRAGIKKRIYPHLFRHSRASHYANKLTEQQLKVFFGWTGDSRMASTYVHLSGRDIDNAILVANGKQPKEVLMAPKLTVKECQRCHYENTIESTYCSRCGLALDPTILMREQDRHNAISNAPADHVTDERFESDLIDKSVKKRKGRK